MNNPLKQQSNVVIDEQKGVDTSEVESVGGAKLEPEERPFVERLILKPDEVHLNNGQTIQGQRMAQTVETDVAAVMESYGKQCGRCKFFNHQQGQTELKRIEVQGTPEEKLVLHNAKVYMVEPGGDELVHPQRVWEDETAPVMAMLGKCHKLTDLHPTKEVQLVLPSMETCPQSLPWMAAVPQMYEAKDADVEAHDKVQFDNLMFTAARKLK